MSHPIQFIYPTSTQFPFDAVCREIVLVRRELDLDEVEILGLRKDFDKEYDV
jgi:hypothetical protein